MKLLIASAFAALLLPAAAAQGGNDCASATPITGYGLYSWNNTSATTTGAFDCNNRPARKDLWFAWTAPATGGVRFETCGTNTSFDTRIVAYDGADCSNLVVADCAAQSCIAGLSITNFQAIAGQVYLLRVGARQLNMSGPGEFRLSPDPCPVTADDGLEDNDDCASAVPVADGTYNNLWCSKTDADYYAFCVAGGDTLNVDFLFTNSTGDIDVYATDDCAVASNIGTSTSGSNDENLNWTNPNVTDVLVLVRVELWSGDQNNDCNDYSMIVSGANGACLPGGLGTNYCMTNPNSTGTTATMIASGSDIVADNNLTLGAIDLPANTPALFITSSMQGFTMNPGGSLGNLCLTGAVGRYTGPGQIQIANGMGEVALGVDLTMIPEGNGFVSAMAGDTRNFQVWFRDIVGGAPVSNFTDGLAITFQ